MKQQIEAQPVGAELQAHAEHIGNEQLTLDYDAVAASVAEEPMYIDTAAQPTQVEATPTSGRKIKLNAHKKTDGSYRLSFRDEVPVAPREETIPAEVPVAPVAETKPQLERPTRVMYDTDSEGKAQSAVVFNAEQHRGLEVNLSDKRNRNREAVVTTASGNRYLVVPFEDGDTKMQIAYDIENSKKSGRQQAFVAVLSEGDAFSPITPGEGWNINGGITEPVTEVAVGLHKFNASQAANSKHVAGGENPFEAVRTELAAIPYIEESEQAKEPVAAEEAAVIDTSEQDTTVIDAVPVESAIEGTEPVTEEIDTVAEEQPMTRRERIRAKMASAAAQLRLIARNPVYGTAALAMNTLSSVTNRENYTRRRKITAAIIGGIGVGAVAYFELKGNGVLGHVAEHKHVSNHDMSNALIPAPKHGNNHHDMANALTPAGDKSKHAHHAAEAKHHLHNAHDAGAHHTGGNHHGTHAHHTATMHSTVWETAQKEMGLDKVQHLTPKQQHAIYQYTDHILRINNLNWDDARHLTEGTKLKV
jgi:hypothetical protein